MSEEQIKTAVQFLQSNGYRNFIITGSVAIERMGYNLGREIHDIDIILIGYDPYDGKREAGVVFVKDGVKINCFVKNDYNFQTKRIDGIVYCWDIEYLLAKKASMGREKDLKDIEIINKQIAEKNGK